MHVYIAVCKKKKKKKEEVGGMLEKSLSLTFRAQEKGGKSALQDNK